MKSKNKTALMQMTAPELLKYVAEEQAKIAKIVVDRATKQMKNVREMRNIRRAIAIARTAIRQKELQHG